MALEWWMAVVGLALVFDFFNGVNDAANSVATIVATRVLSPVMAVGLAAVMNFLGPFVFSLAVAKTIGSGIIDVDIVTTTVIAAAVGGGITATALATFFGLPISVSHSLVGGLLGAGFAAAGMSGILLPERLEVWVLLEWIALGFVIGAAVFLLFAALAGNERLRVPAFVGGMAGASVVMIWGLATGLVEMSKLTATIAFILFSPLIGFGGAFVLGTVVMRIARNSEPERANWWFRKLQLVSVSAFSLSHGTNDAQKTMGIIAVLLLANGLTELDAAGELVVPLWVIVVSAGVIALGTFIGGWRVIETVGHRLTHLQPHQGFTAETAGAGLIFTMTHFGVPVSTTHAITGSIMGVGATKRLRAVRWGVARNIMGAWILTIPISAAVAWILYALLAPVTGG